MNKFSTNYELSKNTPFYQNNNNTIKLGRVRDIILSEKHPDYTNIRVLGAVRFEPLHSYPQYEKSETSNLPIAYPIDSNIKNIPLKNEIIILESFIAGEEALVDNKSSSKLYYSTILSIWNNPNHNALPVLSEIEKNETAQPPDLGKEYQIEERDDVKPLELNPGDILIEGRLGQSIRLGGYTTADNSDSPPFVKISNGRSTDEEKESLLENINNDSSSIYLTSDKSVELEQVRSKYDSLNTNPISAESYKGAQVVINSGRLFFNAKEEDINFTANNIFSVSSETIGIDAISSIGLDAEKIYLGKDARIFEQQPVIRGDMLEAWLFNLVSMLELLNDALKNAVTTRADSIPGFIAIAPVLEEFLKDLRQRINVGGESELKSKKVFVE